MVIGCIGMKGEDLINLVIIPCHKNLIYCEKVCMPSNVLLPGLSSVNKFIGSLVDLDIC